MLTAIFKSILMLSVAGGIVALAILILRALFWRRLPARLQYAIWVLLIARLMMPIAPSSPLSLFGINAQQTSAQSVRTIMPASKPAAVKNTAPVQNTETSGQTKTPAVSVHPKPQAVNPSAAPATTKNAPAFRFSFNYETIAFIWALGASALLFYFFTVNLTMWIILSKRENCGESTVTAALDDCRARLKLRVPVKVVYDGCAKSPGVFGVFRPKIIISKSVAGILDRAELRYIFMHELTHVKRLDNIVNLVIMLLEALNWFNPVLWFAFSKMKEDCEISCDASVLAAIGENERRAYGDTIIVALQSAPRAAVIPGAAGFTGSFSKRRIVMIANKNKKIPVVTIALVLAGTLLAGCASLPASAEKIKARPAAVVLKTVKPSAVKISKNNAALMLNATSIEKNFITYINKSGYDVVKGSMTAGIKLILPKGAKLPETDSATWKFVLRRNGFSKKNGLDFSPYFGKKVALLYCDGKNRGTGKTTELLGLYYNKKLVGFWAMPRLKDVGLPDVSYKFNRDSSVLKEMWGTSGQKEVWDSYLAAWDEFSTDPAERLYTKLGYRIELNSGDEGILTLPKNFKGNSKIGQYFKDCNEKSKKNHLDFSSYLGKKVKLLSYDAEKTNGTLAYLYILYDGKKMVGFWAEQHPLSNDPRRNETYDGLLKWK